jgi:hypothetical protein
VLIALDSVRDLLGSLAAGQMSARHPSGGFGGVRQEDVQTPFEYLEQVKAGRKEEGGGNPIRSWKSAHSLEVVRLTLHSVADHKVLHRPGSNLPSHPIVFSLGCMMNGSTTNVFTS